MENETVNLKVDLTSEDVYKFQKSYLLNGTSKISLAVLSIFVLGLIVSSVIPVINGDFSTAIIAKLITFITIPLVLVIVIPISLKRASVNALNNNKLLQKTQEYSISNEGFSASSESAKVFIKWNEMYKAIETKHDFQFYIAKNQAYIIPKRLLENLSDIENLRAAIKRAPVPKSKGKKIIFWGLFIYIVVFVLLVVILTAYTA